MIDGLFFVITSEESHRKGNCLGFNAQSFLEGLKDYRGRSRFNNAGINTQVRNLIKYLDILDTLELLDCLQVLNLQLKIVLYHAYDMSVLIPLTHKFDELMDNENDIFNKIFCL